MARTSQLAIEVRIAVAALLVLALTMLSGCSSQNFTPAPEYSSPSYYPSSGAHIPPHMEVASWYGPGFQGHPTSTGERYDQNGLTAASRTLPLGSRVRVTNPANGRSVDVRINDRGPYVAGRNIDLSRRAAEQIGMRNRGVAPVDVSSAEPTPGYTPVSYSSPTYSRPASASLAPTTLGVPRELARVAEYDASRALERRKYRRHVSHHSRHRIVSNPVGSWIESMARNL